MNPHSGLIVNDSRTRFQQDQMIGQGEAHYGEEGFVRADVEILDDEFEQSLFIVASNDGKSETSLEYKLSRHGEVDQTLEAINQTFALTKSFSKRGPGLRGLTRSFGRYLMCQGFLQYAELLHEHGVPSDPDDMDDAAKRIHLLERARESYVSIYRTVSHKLLAKRRGLDFLRRLLQSDNPIAVQAALDIMPPTHAAQLQTELRRLFMGSDSEDEKRRCASHLSPESRRILTEELRRR